MWWCDRYLPPSPFINLFEPCQIGWAIWNHVTDYRKPIVGVKRLHCWTTILATMLSFKCHVSYHSFTSWWPIECLCLFHVQFYKLLCPCGCLFVFVGVRVGDILRSRSRNFSGVGDPVHTFMLYVKVILEFAFISYPTDISLTENPTHLVL